MKKGFTLLELIVVIIIIGILATLGITQYTKVIERARGAEAKQILGAIRSNAAALYMQYSSCNPYCSAENVGIGAGLDNPGPAGSNCRNTHYFYYNITPDDNGFTAVATRCTSGGKEPQGAAANTITLKTDFRTTGGDTWASVGGY